MIDPELPSRAFQPLVYGVGAWTSHLHFAYDLVARLRPPLFVELGVDRGESYFAVCQAAAEHRTGTRCVGIDSWHGDQHAGGYDETTFAEVSAHNTAQYEAFSTLRRSSFESALREFSPESIDLLHLDGLHTESAVRADLAAWLPKLRPGGILLLHDVGVRWADFGVWKIWEELRIGNRSYSFQDEPGLGVWQKPPCSILPDFLEALLTAPNENADQLAQYYTARAAEMQEKIAQQWRDGSIRGAPFANQTVVQIFHTHDGVYRAEDSTRARIGHNVWKTVTLPLPAGAGTAPLRIDFLSALTTIDLASILLTTPGRPVFSATSSSDFDQIVVAGDAERLLSDTGLRLKITGPNPQLILPTIKRTSDGHLLAVLLHLCVHDK